MNKPKEGQTSLKLEGVEQIETPTKGIFRSPAASLQALQRNRETRPKGQTDTDFSFKASWHVITAFHSYFQ